MACVPGDRLRPKVVLLRRELLQSGLLQSFPMLPAGIDRPGAWLPKRRLDWQIQNLFLRLSEIFERCRMALEELFSRFTERLIRLARSQLAVRLQAKEDPQDIVQSAMRTFCLRFADGQFSIVGWDSLWAILAKITTRKCLDRSDAAMGRASAICAASCRSARPIPSRPKCNSGRASRAQTRRCCSSNWLKTCLSPWRVIASAWFWSLHCRVTRPKRSDRRWAAPRAACSAFWHVSAIICPAPPTKLAEFFASMPSSDQTPGSANFRELDDIIERFEDAWNRGDNPRLEDFLPTASGRQSTEILIELVHVELERRLTRGDDARVETYLEAYPAIRDCRKAAIELIATEFNLRRPRDPGLTAQQYAARFPEYAELLLQGLADGVPQRVVRRAAPVRINCPHCHSPIELVVGNPFEEVLCPSCGSSFDLQPDHTQSCAQDSLPKLGKFELLDAVGRGAFGTVYRARDTQLRRVVAIKVPRSGKLATDEDEDRFVREARNSAHLQHPGIVPVYEVGRSETFPFIVSEFVEGITLSDALTARRFSFGESAALIASIARRWSMPTLKGSFTAISSRRTSC